IVTQPANQEMDAGTSATLSVAATATTSATNALKYQWRFQGNDIPGAIRSTYTIAAVQGPDAGEYRVVVSDWYGSQSVTSRTATLQVDVPAFGSNSPPIILVQPPSQYANAGDDVLVTVQAIGTPALAYQWRKAGADLTDGGNISGATSSSLALTGVTPTNAGAYTVVITNAFGARTSTPAILTLNDPLAQAVIVESRVGGGFLNSDPPYKEFGTWLDSFIKSSAAGLSGTGSRFSHEGTPSFRVRPALRPGETYSVEITHASSASLSTNIVVSITQSNCSGLPATTTAFQASDPNVWKSVGTLTMDPGQAVPEITFSYLSGLLTPGIGRFYADAVRFVNLSEPCLGGLPQLPTVNGPLATGQTFVNVPNVSAAAVVVTVYADGVAIGQKNVGIAAGVNMVPTAPLVKGQLITATQTDSAGQESCRPLAGPKVGGGANPRLRLSLSIRQNPTLTGPIGANGGTPDVPLKFLGATGEVGGGFATAPVGGKVIQPSTCWQTVTFLRGLDPAHPVDPSYAWSDSDGTNAILGDFGILESLALT
ncbi:MAG: hypothetical protein DME25_16770, partial [Verrucomicrobia bacterium]